MSTLSGSNSPQPSLSAKSTRSVRPHRVAFSCARLKAAGLMSIPTKTPSLSSLARLNIMQPVPVPTSTIIGLPIFLTVSDLRTKSTSNSVSGRGMSARESTLSVSLRKSHWPRMYWMGSPWATRLMPRLMASTRRSSGTFARKR